MKLRFLTTALLALAGALLTQSAQAAFTPGGQATSGDLILAFQANGGTGSTTNYEVDLGSITNFTAGTGTPFSSINLSTDLASIYGASWFNDTNLSWVVVGTVNNGNLSTSAGTIKNGSVLATDPNAPTVIPAEGSTTLGNAKSHIGSLYQPDSAATVLTAPNSISILTTDTQSFNQTSGGTESFGSLGPIGATFTASGTAPLTLALDLLQPTGFTTGTSTLVNSPSVFSLASDGTFSFGQAVPEPSTYAMLLGGFLILWQLNRRKSASTI